MSPTTPIAPARALELARRSAQFVAPQRARVAVILALALLVATLGAAEPLVTKFVFDELAGAGLSRSLGLGIGVLIGLEIARTIFGGWMSIVTWDVRLAVDFAIRERLVAKLNALPLSYHQRESVGATMTRLNQGVGGFVNAFGEIAFSLLPAIVFLALSIVAMARLDWRLSLLVIVFTPLPAVIGAWAAKEQTSRERHLMDRWTDLYSRFNEVLANIRAVKAFNMERAEQARFLRGQQEGNDIVRRGTRMDTLTGALRGFAATAARLVALAYGGYLATRGEITIGTLVAFLGYIGALFGPVQGLTNSYQTLRKGTVSLEIIYGILDSDDEVADAAHAVDLEAPKGDVKLREVEFGYRPEQPVLEGLSLHVTPGETVAIVGPSGSGKTTVALLLQRFFHATGGSITVDGIDVRDLTQRSLRRHIGVVYQDALLFNDTVRANIAYGCPDATPEMVEAAARAANAHEFIMQLPQGFDTVIGERGGFLSGGQRQRIGIARVFLQDPTILILDEATSALDAQSESLIQDALRTISRGRTTFIIAHRLSTVVEADRIVVLRRGRIEAVGTHAELMREGGYYASLVHRQSRGLILPQAA